MYICKTLNMKKVWWVIGIVSLFALVFQVSPYVGVPDAVIFGMFFVAPFAMVYMVYVILKYGVPSGRTFDERFYDDVDL